MYHLNIFYYRVEAITALSQTSPFNPNWTTPMNEDLTQDTSSSDSDESLEPFDDDLQDPELREQAKQENEEFKQKWENEMLGDYDDPLTYYFQLKEKNKPIPPLLLNMIKNQAYETSRTLKKRSGNIPSFTARKSTKKDVFEKDPFFKEFQTSMNKRPQGESAGLGFIKVGLLRRSRRDTGGLVMAKYKVAAEIAQHKDPEKCRTFFNICPFSSEEVMSMISKLNSEDQDKQPKDKGNKEELDLANLKNTLLAIEKLNDATLNAEALGESVNYTKVVEDSVKPEGSEAVKMLDELEEYLTPEYDLYVDNDPQVLRKRMLTKSQAWIRKRRQSHIRSKNYRIKNRRHPLKRGPRYSDEDSDEDSSEEKKAPTIDLSKSRNKLRPPQKKPSKLDSLPKKVVKNQGEDEDDELHSPESEEVPNVPSFSFSQSFIDTLGTQIRKRPKPVHKQATVKPQVLRSTIPTTSVPLTTHKPRRKPTTPLPKLSQKYSGQSEDDEEDAINKEKEIDALVSKYKPKDSKPRH